MEPQISPSSVKAERQSLESPESPQLLSQSLSQRRNLLPTRRLVDFEPLRQPKPTYQHGRDSPVWRQPHPLNPPDPLDLPRQSFQPEDPLSCRYPIHFGPLWQPGQTYQRGRDSPVWGGEEAFDPPDATRLPHKSSQSEGPSLPASGLIDFEPLKQPSPAYQRHRDSMVWGQQQSLDPSDTPELPEPSFQPEDPFVETRHLTDIELPRRPKPSPQRGRHSPIWGRELALDLPDISGLFLSEYNLVYSNGWINQIPVRPLEYEYRMLPILSFQNGQDSSVRRDLEPLSINGSGLFQDPHMAKRRVTHHRSTSLERACKDRGNELNNNALNSKLVDADINVFFDSLERLETLLAENQPSTEAPPEPSVKPQSKRFKVSKRPRDERPDPNEEAVNIENRPYWVKDKLGIRLPWGMVNLAQTRLPTHLVRKLKDPLRYLPSKLSFKENFPFGNVIPNKGQIGLPPAFRRAAPEDILKAIELAKENRSQTPEKAWWSPIIGDSGSDYGWESTVAPSLTTGDNRSTRPTQKSQGRELAKSENNRRRADEDSQKPLFSEPSEPFPDQIQP